MANREKRKFPDFFQLDVRIKAGKLLPVYFLFGKEEDRFSVEKALEYLIEKFSSMIGSDFDKESFAPSGRQNFGEIIDHGLSFPFGAGKKLIVVKDFNDYDNKKQLIPYLQNPPEFTILILTQVGGEFNFKSEPYKTLQAGGFCFQPPQSKGTDLVNWVVSRTKKRKKNISAENAGYLIQIVGEIKGELDVQIKNICDYVGDEIHELDLETIRKVSSPLRKYEIYDLYEALKKDKKKAVTVALNLFDYSKDPPGITISKLISSIHKFIITVARVNELEKDYVEGKEEGKKPAERLKDEMHTFFYFKCKEAKEFFSDSRLSAAGSALLKADLSLKSTSVDPRIIVTVLISELFDVPKDVSLL